jgi:hypothetical protein
VERFGLQADVALDVLGKRDFGPGGAKSTSPAGSTPRRERMPRPLGNVAIPGPCGVGRCLAGRRVGSVSGLRGPAQRPIGPGDVTAMISKPKQTSTDS